MRKAREKREAEREHARAQDGITRVGVEESLGGLVSGGRAKQTRRYVWP